MIIDISIAVIAAAFVVFVIFLVLVLHVLRKTLHQVNRTLVDLRGQLDDMGGQTKKVIEHTNQISFDLKRKMESLNPVFNSVSNLGDILEQKTLHMKKVALASSHKEHKSSDLESSKEEETLLSQEEVNVADILELVGIVARLWHKLKNKYSPNGKN